jgi:hypothetical protein
MKSTILFFAAVIVITGCTKSMNGDETQNEQSAMRIESVMGSGDFQSRVQMYNLLSPTERLQMWREHLVKAKNQFIGEVRPDKVSLIDELLSNLRVNVFESGSVEGDVFLNYFIPVWDSRAKTVFDDFEMYDLTFNPSAEIIGSRTAPPEIGETPGGTADCFCHVGMSGFSCRRITISIPPSITNGICERTPADCKERNLGCGWFLLSSCKGNHCQF